MWGGCIVYMGIPNGEIYIRIIYEKYLNKWKEKLYIFEFTSELYIYLSTTDTILHGKTLLHIEIYLSLLTGYSLALNKIIKFNCLILNLSLLCLTTICFAVNSLK